MISIFAPAKLNLTLKILNRYKDGYHNIESIIAFAAVGDTIIIKNSKKFRVKIIGPERKMLLKAGGEDLIKKTCLILSKKAGIDNNINITLIKRLPSAAGLGGGSADAAATLRGLSLLHKPSIPRHLIEEVACELGSDVLACLHSKTLLLKGKGSKILPLPNITRGLWTVIVNPRIITYTKDIFAAYNSPFSKSVRPVRDKDYLGSYLQKHGNDLTKVISKIVPETKTMINSLSSFPAANFTRVSGSGSSVFSLFKNSEEAYKIASVLKQRRKKWWVSAIPLIN